MKNPEKYISIVGSSGIPAKYGGFETLSEELVINLFNQIPTLVYCSQKYYSKKEQLAQWPYSKRKFVNIRANGVSSILYDLACLVMALRHSKTILLLGCSAGIFLPIFRLIFPGKSFIYHPDGLEWKRNKWNIAVKIYLQISNFAACLAANKIIIDNIALLDIYSKFKDKISIIPYGGDHLPKVRVNKNNKNWIIIARAVPENQFELICSVFTKIPHEQLSIISDYNNSRYGKKIFKKYNTYKNITFLGPIYEKNKLAEQLYSCKGYIHPHTAGGTNPSLTTAMWYEVPILCYDNKFNRATTDNTCYYFSSKESLTRLIQSQQLMANPKTLEKAKTDYSWELISKKYLTLFIK